MDQQIQKNREEINLAPDYRKIYFEIIERYHPEKRKSCEAFLKKELWTSLDVITVNEIIFGSHKKEVLQFNQSHRSYDQTTVQEILEYQEKHKLNNVQVANMFKLSRNTLTKWKSYSK